MRDPETAARAVDGVTRGQPPGGDGRARRRPRRHRRLRRAQRPRHRRAAAGARRARASAAGSCSPRAWSSTARAATAAPSTGSCARRRAPPPTSTPAASSRPARPAAARSTPEPVPEDAPLDPRNVYAATKVAQEHLCAAFARETGATVTALRYHNVYGPRMPRDTPYAGVASIFRSALAAGERAARVRGRRPAARLRPRPRRRARANVLALEPSPSPARSTSPAARRARVGDMARALARAVAPDREPVVTGEWRAGDVRHVFASPDARRRASSASARARTSRPAMREFAAAPLRA